MLSSTFLRSHGSTAYLNLNNCSDDAREQISAKLEEYKHPLDTRRKDNNRVRQNKWFTGEAWRTFCSGERGSPGGPLAIASLVMIIAEDMLQNGVDNNDATAVLENMVEIVRLAVAVVAALAPAVLVAVAVAVAANPSLSSLGIG